MRFLLVLLGLIFSTYSSPSKACSSCGSGGADPLILAPYENMKVLLQLTQQKGIRDIAYDGSESRSWGPEVKYIYTSSIAYRLMDRAFISLTMPFHSNERGDSWRQGWGDPLLTARYTLLRQNLLEPYRPQIQLIAAHKNSQSPSIHSSSNIASLDVRSSGFDENILGLDLWFGMSKILGGGSYFWVAPGRLNTELAGRIEREQEHRAFLTIGYQWDQRLSIVGGLRYRSHNGLIINQIPQPQSSVRESSWFMTAESRMPSFVNYRLTISENASIGKNRNTARYMSVSLGLIGRIL